MVDNVEKLSTAFVGNPGCVRGCSHYVENLSPDNVEKWRVKTRFVDGVENLSPDTVENLPLRKGLVIYFETRRQAKVIHINCG